MNKQWILLSFLIFVFMIGSTLGLSGQELTGQELTEKSFEQKPVNENPGTGQVCIKNNCFSVEIAVTRAQKEFGLMNREYLPLNNGMLFVYEDERDHHFWMKNTLIPLDIIWINSNYDIVYIQKNAQPCPSGYYCPSFGSGKNASYVLEINGGLSDKYDINVGDRANISYTSTTNPRENFLNKKHPEIYRIIRKFIEASENVLNIWL